MAAYTLDSLFDSNFRDFSAKDLLKAAAAGGIGGGLGGWMGAQLGGGFGGSVVGGLEGGAVAYGGQILFGEKGSWERLGLSLGSGLAGSLASEGVQDLALWAEVSGGSAEGRQKVRDAMVKIEQTTRGKQLLALGLMKHREPLRIILNDHGEYYYAPPGSERITPATIEINSDDYVGIDPSMKNEAGKPAEIWVSKGSTDYKGPWLHEDLALETLESALGHELGHDWGGILGDPGINGMDNVIANENPMRQEWGLPPRSNYNRPSIRPPSKTILIHH
jgi:hypothetical protein